MTLVIMAAGMGSRYGGLKQLDPIGKHGEFILDYSIYDAIEAGFDKVVFIIKEENLQLFKETVGNRIEKAIQVEYVFQDITNVPSGIIIPEARTKPLGTAHAVYCSEPIVKENFAVINADDFYGKESFKLLFDFMKNLTGNHFGMVGFVLKNTLTDNGHVARGICTLGANDSLKTVTEMTHLERNKSGIVQNTEDDIATDIDENSIVSMNFWGFTPEIFPAIQNGFHDFYSKNINNLDKAEYFLPFVVDDLVKASACDVKVLSTNSKWYGVTYHDDKATLVEFMQQLIKDGVYPEQLW